MSRLIVVVAWGLMLAACSATMSNLNLDFMKSSPKAETLTIESEPRPGALGLGSGTIRNQLSLAVAITGPGRRDAGDHSQHRVRHPAVVIDRAVAEYLEVLGLARV